MGMMFETCVKEIERIRLLCILRPSSLMMRAEAREGNSMF
jgi:hypothetical protein